MTFHDKKELYQFLFFYFFGTEFIDLVNMD